MVGSVIMGCVIGRGRTMMKTFTDLPITDGIIHQDDYRNQKKRYFSQACAAEVP